MPLHSVFNFNVSHFAQKCRITSWKNSFQAPTIAITGSRFCKSSVLSLSVHFVSQESVCALNKKVLIKFTHSFPPLAGLVLCVNGVSQRQGDFIIAAAAAIVKLQTHNQRRFGATGQKGTEKKTNKKQKVKLDRGSVEVAQLVRSVSTLPSVNHHPGGAVKEPMTSSPPAPDANTVQPGCI